MKATARLFWILTVFSFFISVVYTVWAIIYHTQQLATPPTGVEWLKQVEWVGSIALALVGALSMFVAFYLSRQIKAQRGELPEDRLDANIDDGDAEQGHFSPWSWWPVILAGSSALVVLGLAIGPWISFIGAGILIISLVGWVFEYYRGNFGH
jgi:hypothetical protein